MIVHVNWCTLRPKISFTLAK